jgi:Tol biopolymer transport system component
MANMLANVYISSVKDGKWQSGEDIGETVNTKEGDEEIVGVCADGNTLIFSFDNKEGKGDVFVGPKMDNQILKPFKVNPNINSSKFEESSASISPDGKTLYFASNRAGGLGGFDIYRTRILPSGEWGEAYNLGPDVNTIYDEDFPNISLDGYTLYFSSKGHNSMGGYDVFKSEILTDSLNFGPAKNVGYPINTPFDDKNLCMSGKGRYGYMAALRKRWAW